MSPEVLRALSFVALGLFVAWVVLKLALVLPPRDAEGRAAFGRYRDALGRARAAGDDATRAAAYRDAALIALEELRRPAVAATHARRADALEPSEPENISLLVRAMRGAARYGALETMLYRRLADADPKGPRYEALFEALCALYEGPLRRPERAKVLRTLRGRASAAA